MSFIPFKYKPNGMQPIFAELVMSHSNIDFQVTNFEQPETQGEYKPNRKELTLFSTAESDCICWV